jgi:hypothetical protein
MRWLLVLLSAFLVQAVWAQWDEASNVGAYKITTGLEIWTVELRPDHMATYAYGPDHPGSYLMTGKWRLSGDIVIVTFAGTLRGKKQYHEWRFVPVVWGNRRYLILLDEIRDFAGLCLKWLDENKDAKSQTHESHRAPLMRWSTAGTPKRFGTPKAPGRFNDWFDTISCTIEA